MANFSKDTRQKNIPELLSPAGSIAALRAAVDAGADAVYFAMPEFNARINADNFTPESFAEGVELCHLSGVRAYITLNTQVYDRERADFLKTAEKAYLAGVDAAIVGDIGAAKLLREYIPELELHASTQLSGHRADAAKLLSSLGFSRMVCAREMSLADIRAFTESSPIEAEIFIHGALCVCHSGQCLFSSLVGGRSGNRGLCAQPCRLPYKTPKGKNEYPLSLKDMSLAAHIPEIIDSGVASLKIEGRMKPAEYVYGVTSIYRRLLDERRSATPEELRRLADIFSRGGGFTDAYFTGKARGSLGNRMLGVRSDGDKARSKETSSVGEKAERKTPVSIRAEIKREEPMKLTVTLNGGYVGRFKGIESPSVTVCGDVPDLAISRPTDMDTVTKSLSKLGGTPFVCEGGSVQFDEGLMIPHSSLNALRRAGVEALTNAILAPYKKRTGFALPDTSRLSAAVRPSKSLPGGERIAIFYSRSQITPEAKEYFDRIYLPLDDFETIDEKGLYRGGIGGVMLPPVIFDTETPRAEELLKKAWELGIRDAMVDNIGHLDIVKRLGFTPHGGMRLGVVNTDSAKRITALGFEDLTLSPELTVPRMRDIANSIDKAGAIVYGKIPLMVTEKCLIREISSCDECRRAGGAATLTDRTGARFPVRREFGHRSLIFNSMPTYTADLGDKLAFLHSRVFIFTDESASEVDGIIDAYRRSTPPKGKVRRV